MSKSSPTPNLQWLLTFSLHLYHRSRFWQRRKVKEGRKEEIQFKFFIIVHFFTFAKLKHIYNSAKRSWKWNEIEIESECFWISLSSFSRFCSKSWIPPESSCIRKWSIVDDLMNCFYAENNVVGYGWWNTNLIYQQTWLWVMRLWSHFEWSADQNSLWLWCSW